MHHEIELLSPAGNWDSLTAAVQNGANAVYLGGKAFNARQHAGNFDDKELEKAIRYCHIRGVQVYLTLNTLLNDTEIGAVSHQIMSAYNAGIDAVIVQDLGVAKIVRALAPMLSIHASTQMTVHNVEGVKALEELGFDRVVLSRELNAEEIRYICTNTSMEIEVFVHGALCVCYSGQCLMSSLIGGRSGNRGSCAQPCRLPYDLVEFNSEGGISSDRSVNMKQKKYLLSPKDLSLIESLSELKDAGVKSLKIEGRMKRPEYVAAVTGVYRKYLDKGGEVQQTDYNALLQVFNRGGFTQSYFKGKKGFGMMSVEKPKHWGLYIGDVERYDPKRKLVFITLQNPLNIGDGIEIWTKDEQHPNTKVTKLLVNGKEQSSAQKGQAVGLYIKGMMHKGNKVYKTYDIKLDQALKMKFGDNIQEKKIPIYGHCSITMNHPMHLRVWDDEGNFVEVEGQKKAEEGLHKTITQDKVLQQLNKLGGTPFEFADIRLEMENGLILPISDINDVRRKAVELMEHKRYQAHNCTPLVQETLSSTLKQRLAYRDNLMPKQPRLHVQIHHYLQAQALINSGVDRVYIPIRQLFDKETEEKCSTVVSDFISRGIEVVVVLPRILRKKDFTLYHAVMSSLDKIGIKSIFVGNIGAIHWMSKYQQYDLLGDFGLNVFNSLAAGVYGQLGLKGLTLSPELTLKQIANIQQHNTVATEMIAYGRLPLMITEHCPIDKCNTCGQHTYGLLDRTKKVFPILTDKTICRTEILNSQPLFMADRIEEMMNTGINAIRLLFTTEDPLQCEQITQVYVDALKKGQAAVEQEHVTILEQIRQQGFTRGHYYRGV